MLTMETVNVAALPAVAATLTGVLLLKPTETCTLPEFTAILLKLAALLNIIVPPLIIIS